jgi:hypothetical protein
MKRQAVQAEEMPAFIGIDYHKAYSVYSALNAQDDSLGHGRINHAHPEDFSNQSNEGAKASSSLSFSSAVTASG